MAAAAILSELSGVRQISDAILLSVRFIFALTRVSTALCPPRALVSAQPVPIAHRRVAVGSAGRLLRAGQGRLVRHSCRHDGGKGAAAGRALAAHRSAVHLPCSFQKQCFSSGCAAACRKGSPKALLLLHSSWHSPGSARARGLSPKAAA